MATDTHERSDELDARLRQAIAGLEDREPARDLWPGIAGRITTRRPTMLTLRWPAAIAAALALVAGGAVLGGQLGRTPAAAPSAPLASGQSGAVPVLPAGFDEAERTLESAITRLEEAYAAAAPSLPREVQVQITESLEALDAAITDARLRAGSAPSDLGAARYLTRTLQRKLDVLQTAATMASARS